MAFMDFDVAGCLAKPAFSNLVVTCHMWRQAILMWQQEVFSEAEMSIKLLFNTIFLLNTANLATRIFWLNSIVLNINNMPGKVR
jgi:hypothetical protein